MAWIFYRNSMTALMKQGRRGKWTDCDSYIPPKFFKPMKCKKGHDFCYSMSCDDYQSSVTKEKKVVGDDTFDE